MKWISLIAVPLALFIGIGSDNIQADPVSATVYSIAGLSEFAPPQSLSFHPLKVGQTLAIGSTVRTGNDGKVVLETTPGSSVVIGSDSVLKINDLAFEKSSGSVTERKARLELTSGVISALVDPSTPNVNDFKIQTPEGALVARGTLYTVVVKDGKTYASTKEGKISAIAQPTIGSI